MKKALLAASIAMMCAGASAQSYVNIYGRVNLSLEHMKDGPTDSNQMVDNSSRWGLIGNEDLGGGMKAFFQLENGFDASTGGSKGTSTTVKTTNVNGVAAVTSVSASSKAWSREAFVGVGGKLGSIRAGSFTSPLYLATADYVSNHNHDTGTSADILFDSAPDGSYAMSAGGYPMTNAYSYKTPDFNGLVAEVAQSLSEDVAGTGGVTTLSFNYDDGPLHLGGGYGHTKPRAAQDNNQIVVIRGLYELGSVILGGYFEWDEFAGKKRTNARFSAMYVMGSHEFHGNVGVASDLEDLNDSGAVQGTVGYNYNLSKRTKVYSFFTLIRNDDNASYGVSANGKTFRSLAVGVRHNF